MKYILAILTLTAVAFGQVVFSGGATVTNGMSIGTSAIAPPPLLQWVTTSPLPTGQSGTFYTQTFNGQGGTLPYSCSLQAGTLPTSVTLGGSGNCVLSGTPSVASTFNFTILLTDSSVPTQTVPQSFTVVINSAPPPAVQITTTTLPSGFATIFYSQSLNATGGVPPYTWTTISGAPPTGITVSSSGVVSGTTSVVGNANFTVKATDTLSANATQALRLTINSAPPSDPTLPILPTAWVDQNEFRAVGHAPTYISCLATAAPAGGCTSADAYTTGAYPYPNTLAGLIQAIADAEGRRIDALHVYGGGQTGPGGHIVVHVGTVLHENGGQTSVQLKNGTSAASSTGGSNQNAPCNDYSGQNGNPFIGHDCPHRYQGPAGTEKYNWISSDNPGPVGVPVGFREISSIVCSGGNRVDITTALAHQFNTSDFVDVWGVLPPNPYNFEGQHLGPITKDSATAFHYTPPGGTCTNGSGTLNNSSFEKFSLVIISHPTLGDPHSVADDVATYMFTISAEGLDNRCHNPDPGATRWVVTDEECDYNDVNESGAGSGGNHLSLQSGAPHPHPTDVNGNATQQAVVTDLPDHIMYLRDYPHGHDSLASPAISVTSLTCSAGTATVTIPGVANQFKTQLQFDLAGFSPAGFNGTYLGTNTATAGGIGSNDSLTFPITCPASTGTGGTAVLHFSTFNSRAGQCGGSYIAYADNYTSQIHGFGQDSHTNGAVICSGPFKIFHNYLEAASENVIMGGSLADVFELNGDVMQTAKDVEIRTNWFNKPYASWYNQTINGKIYTPGGGWAVKNIFELKDGSRMVIDGNIFSNEWVDGQDGTLMLLAPRTGSSGIGGLLGIAAEKSKLIVDLTITNNWMHSATQAVNVGGRSNGPGNGERVSYPTQRVRIANNFITDIGNYALFGNPGAPPKGLAIGASGQNYSCTMVRNAAGTIATATCSIPAGGSTRTTIVPGDAVYVQGCTDVSFNTPLNVLGPSALAGSLPDGLTVVYPSVGTANATTSCTNLGNFQGWPKSVIWDHNTIVANGAIKLPTQAFGPPRNPSFTKVTNSIVATNTAGGGFTCSTAAVGTAAFPCYDTSTMQFHHNLYPLQTASKYTELGGVNAGATPPVTILFPAAVPCSGATATSACVGFTGLMSGAAYNMTLDYHQYTLVPTASGHNAASDGTDIGADAAKVDAARTQSVYTCPYTCGSPGPY